jgi:hypothetical protein
MVTEFVSKTEPSSPWIGRSVNDRNTKIPDVDVGSVTSIGTERQGKSEQPQSLDNQLKVQ